MSIISKISLLMKDKKSHNENRNLFDPNYVPFSSAVEMDNFIKSIGWKDVKDFLEHTRTMLRDKLEKVDGRELVFIQGQIEQIKGLLVLPDAMLDDLRIREKEPVNNE